MMLRFTKMHGLGNDFVVLNGIDQVVDLSPEQIRRLADRHFGIGCDQLLIVESPPTPDLDFRYRIFNADGGEVEQCGNGARCFVRFVHDQGLTDKREIAVVTAAGVIRPRLEADGRVTVDMGQPRLEPADIPFQAARQAPLYTLRDGDQDIELAAVSMGNPHAVIRVESVDTAAVATLGPRLERHPRFPRRVNVGFMQIVDRNNIRLRVFERGSGETLACGSGACAAVVAGRVQGLLDQRVQVHLRGGELDLSWAGPGEPVWMTGPAVSVFDGVIDAAAVSAGSDWQTGSSAEWRGAA